MALGAAPSARTAAFFAGAAGAYAGRRADRACLREIERSGVPPVIVDLMTAAALLGVIPALRRRPEVGLCAVPAACLAASAARRHLVGRYRRPGGPRPRPRPEAVTTTVNRHAGSHLGAAPGPKKSPLMGDNDLSVVVPCPVLPWPTELEREAVNVR